MSAWSEEQVRRWLAENVTSGYQHIQLPYNLSIQGKDRSRTFTAMFPDRLEGKTYYDVGCSYGAMCFMAEEAGASDVLGIDRRNDSIEIARGVAEIKGSDARFLVADVDRVDSAAGLVWDYPPVGGFDVVSCFNVIHHLRHPFLALRRMLSLATELFGIEFVTPRARYRKLSGLHLDARIADRHIGVVVQEPGIYIGIESLKTIAGWYGFALDSHVSPAPRAKDREIAVFRRVA